MTAQLALALLGGTGFVGTLITFLTWLNTRRSTKSKSDGDAVAVWRTFMGGAVEDAVKIAEAVKQDRDRLNVIRAMLIDLTQALIASLRALRAPSGEVEAYQDRLDDIRRR